MQDPSKPNTDEVVRTLREEPNSPEATAILEELRNRWVRFLARRYRSLDSADYQDIVQNAWIRLWDHLVKGGSEIRRFWPLADSVCRGAAVDWIRWKKGRRRRRGWGQPVTAERTRGVEVSLDSAKLFAHGPSPEAEAVRRQQIERIVDGFHRNGHPDALERLLEYDEKGADKLAAKLGLKSAATRKMIQRLREKAQKYRAN